MPLWVIGMVLGSWSYPVSYKIGLAALFSAPRSSLVIGNLQEDG